MTTRFSLMAFIALGTSAGAFADASTSFELDFSQGSSTTTVKGQDAPNSFGNAYDDKTADSSSAYSYTFSDGDLSATVEAGVIKPRDNDGSPSSSDTFQGGDQGVYVGRYNGGLGVGWEINPHDLDDDEHTADGSRGRDFLVVDFNQAVELSALTFNYYGSWFKEKYTHQTARSENYVDVQVFTRAFDDNNSFQDTLVGDFRINPGTDQIDFGGELIAGQTFVIMPSEGDDVVSSYFYKWVEEHEWFKLRGVSGTALLDAGEENSNNPVVPTPNAAIAAMVMLGLAGARSRRRRDR